MYRRCQICTDRFDPTRTGRRCPTCGLVVCPACEPRWFGEADDCYFCLSVGLHARRQSRQERRALLA